jgi:hypothetical protein
LIPKKDQHRYERDKKNLEDFLQGKETEFKEFEDKKNAEE